MRGSMLVRLTLTFFLTGSFCWNAAAALGQVGPTPAAEDKKKGELTAGLRDETTYIRSDALQLNSIERNFDYSGNVEVRRGDMIMTADRLQGRYTDKNQIENLTANGNVVITRAEELRATAGQAIYVAAEDAMTLTDNPELMQKENILTADSFKIFLKDNRSVAQGQVRVRVTKQSGDVSSLVKK